MDSPQSSLRLKSSIYAAQYSSTYIALNMDCVSKAIGKIFHYLDGNSRGTARQVCHTWKQIIDEEVGLFLRVDDREKDNPCFVRLTRIERAILQNIEKFEKYISFKYPEFIRMLFCAGPAPAKWFREKVLSKCVDLTRLELSGKFLFSNDLCTCDPSNGRSSPISLPNLRTFTMFIDYTACQEYLRERMPQGKLQVVWGALVGCRFQDLYFLRETVDLNVAYMLNTIRSSQLSLFYIFVDPMHFEDPKNMYSFEWKKDALEIFLEYHRNTLKRLYLPTFETNSRELRDFRMLPEQLKTLELSLVQKGRHRRSSFSEKILVQQNALEELRLEKSYVGEFKNSDMPQLSLLIKQNEKTLRYVNLTVHAPDHELLNGTLFKGCLHLETLVFGATDEHLEFYNLCDLPKSLNTLKISLILVLTREDKAGISAFRNLETLALLDIHLQIESTMERHAFQIHFLQALFHLRQLSSLFLEFSDETYAKTLNSMIGAMGVKRLHESTEEFHTLEIYGTHRRSTLPHFLDSCPLTRDRIEPMEKPLTLWEQRALARCESICDVAVNSNIFHPTLGPRRPDDNHVSIWDFCAGIYTLEDDY